MIWETFHICSTNDDDVDACSSGWSSVWFLGCSGRLLAQNDSYDIVVIRFGNWIH